MKGEMEARTHSNISIIMQYRWKLFRRSNSAHFSEVRLSRTIMSRQNALILSGWEKEKSRWAIRVIHRALTFARARARGGTLILTSISSSRFCRLDQFLFHPHDLFRCSMANSLVCVRNDAIRCLLVMNWPPRHMFIPILTIAPYWVIQAWLVPSLPLYNHILRLFHYASLSNVFLSFSLQSCSYSGYELRSETLVTLHGIMDLDGHCCLLYGICERKHCWSATYWSVSLLHSSSVAFMTTLYLGTG